MKKTGATRAIILIFTLIPLRARKCIFQAVFILFYHISGRHRLITLHNISRSFPEKTPEEITSLAKKVFRNLGIVAAEFFEIPNFTKDNIVKWVEFEGIDNYRAAHAKQKGILFFTAHFGNWEIMAAYFGLVEQPANIIYRSLDNPVLNDLSSWVRSFTGNTLIPKGGAIRKILRLLNDNGLIGILIDQNVAWQEGVFVDFFNRPASTTHGLAALALQTGAPVIPVFIVRKSDGKYKIVVQKEVRITKTDGYEADLITNTQKFTHIIEDMVRQYPDHWFWLHQRWKTKLIQVDRQNNL